MKLPLYAIEIYQNTYQLADLVRQEMTIEDITLGGEQQGYVMRCRGRLLDKDTSAAYNRLAERLSPFNLTPLFRWDEGRHAVLLVAGMPKPKPSNSWINLGLFIITFLSIVFSGGLYGMEEMPTGSGLQIAWAFIRSGLPFALSLIAILAAHEFGHYFAGRYHGVHVTLPYFIPFPFSQFGTMGAFINMKELPKNRRVLLDIGVAGPLSGLVVAIPLLLFGLMLSSTQPIPVAAAGRTMLEGNSILYLFLKLVVFGKLLPEPASFNGVPQALYWVRYFFTGRPFPLGATDVFLHPVAWAGWAGLLVTSLNLIPAGQLDGGHVIYVLLGREKAQRLFPFILVGLGLLGFVWGGWWLWALLIFMLGRRFAEPLDQITELDQPRRIIALIGFVLFFLTFIPVPLILF